MRIFNSTKASMSLPLPNGQVISIPSHSVSGDIMANADFLSQLVTSYTTDEMAFIVAGPYELSICSRIPTVTEYVVQTLDEALQRFGLKPNKEEAPAPAAEPEVPAEAPKTEEAAPEAPKPAAKKRGRPKKKD